jgi:hypothetical protein
MELILLHFHHLLIAIASASPPTSTHVPASDPAGVPAVYSSYVAGASSSVGDELDLTLSTHQTVTLFVSFLKKSLKLHCWKQQFTANPTLGKTLLRTLVILSTLFPLQTLKIIEHCTSKDLFASTAAASSPALLSLTSVLGEIQTHLLALQSTILSNITVTVTVGSCVGEDGRRRTRQEQEEDSVADSGNSGNRMKEIGHIAEKRPRLE